MYTILVKVLTNCLQKVIRSVMSDIRSTFIKERQILNNILIANEVIDEAHKIK